MVIWRTSILKNYSGMMLWPFLLVAKDQDYNDATFMNHECIHAAQQKELLLLFFYLWYLFEYLKHRISHSHDVAYRHIIFEKEAYAMEHDLDYINTRKPWAFLSFYNKTR